MSTKSYNFIYMDMQYMTYDLTDEDFQTVMHALASKDVRPFITLSCGAVSTHQLRFVSLIKEEAKPVKTSSAVPPEYEMDMFLYEKGAMTEEVYMDDDGEPV